MAGSPRVQLSLKGRLLSEVAFVGPQLRIGRMRENDVVVNNLAVSRFHATLRQEGDGFVIEDLGSENGTQLNGERIQGAVPVKPSDVIQLGKYELRIVLQPGLQIAGPPKQRANDAWDSSRTFLALDPSSAPASKSNAPPPTPQAKPAPKAEAIPPKPTLPILDAVELEPEPPIDTPAPDPDGVFAFGEDDLASLAAEPADAEPGEIETKPFAAPNPEHTSLFDFGAPAATEQVEVPPAAGEAAPSASSAPDAAALHAGLIVQRDGKLHLLRAWEDGELCAGRAPECDIVLADAGVSRRHAVFTRAGEGYGVRDLESVNGIYVNGQRAKHHVLTVGDVVRIESYELTFVLDHQPIGSEVSGPATAAGADQDTGRATQFSMEAPVQESEEAFELTPLAGDPTEAPMASAAAPFEDNTDGFEVLPAADDPLLGSGESPEPALELSLPEADVLGAEDADDEEKEVAAQQRTDALSPAAAPLPASGPLELRLVLDCAQLSPRARDALAVLEEEGVSLHARVSFERGGAR